MNREIKFRAFTKRWGMVYPDNHDYEIYVHAQAVWKGGCDEEGVELMQFTGLFDKNGNAIYEGDIVMCRVQDAQTGISKKGYAGIIHWNHSYFAVGEYKLFIMDDKTLKVIGNVFENKELLT